MSNLDTDSAGRTIARLLLTVTLLSFSPSDLLAQVPAVDKEVLALREEVSELKKHLAEVEAKLAAIPIIKTADPQPSSVAPTVAAAPRAATEQAASKPAPFAFGDFTWMNGQSRQKTQPLSNSFATVNLYLDTYYYGYSFNQPRDDTIVGSGAVRT